MLVSAAESIFSILFLIIIGYFLAFRKWFDENSINLIVKLINQVSLPALVIHTLVSNFTRKQLLSSVSGLITAFVSILLSYIIAIAVSRLLKISSARRGVFISMFFNSNTIFMGLPINQALYGQISLPYVLLYYIVNTFFFWTFGVYEISKDGMKNKAKFFSGEVMRNLISLPLIGFATAVIIIISGISLPSWLINSCKYLGDLTTPLSMIFVGITIYSADLRDFKLNRNITGVLGGRFLICPLVMFGLLFLNHSSGLMKNVFVIQATMPVMTNSAIISKRYNSDYKFAAVMITITTIASLVIIPLYATLLDL